MSVIDITSEGGIMKKSNLTAVEYQYKIRQQVKKRVVRHREGQKKKGYKNLTVFLSENFLQELDKLSQEKDYNRQQAMQHIFDIYMHHSITSNKKNPAKKPVNIEPAKKPKKTPGKTTDKKLPYNKAEICKIIVDLKDNKNMSYSAIARELKARGHSPKTKGKTDFHHSTITKYYKES